MTFEEAKILVSKNIKPNQLVDLYPQGKQFGNPEKQTQPEEFTPHRAAKNISTGGWGLTPNLKDEANVKNILIEAKGQFASEMSEKDKEIQELNEKLAKFEALESKAKTKDEEKESKAKTTKV